MLFVLTYHLRFFIGSSFPLRYFSLQALFVLYIIPHPTDRPFADALSGIHQTDEHLPTQSSIISFPHPHHGKSVKFMLIQDRFLELNLVEPVDFRSHPHSWFIGNTVVSDGSLYIASPVDPVFLALPFLESACQKSQSGEGCYVSLFQALSPTSTSNPATRFLATVCFF